MCGRTETNYQPAAIARGKIPNASDRTHMNTTSLTPGDIERALWIATGCAALAGSVLTYVVYRFHWIVAARTRMRLLAALLALILAGSVYVACGTILLAITYLQVYQIDPEAVLAGRLFIHPGWLHKLMPVVAIAVSWTLLALIRKNRSENSTAA